MHMHMMMRPRPACLRIRRCAELAEGRRPFSLDAKTPPIPWSCFHTHLQLHSCGIPVVLGSDDEKALCKDSTRVRRGDSSRLSVAAGQPFLVVPPSTTRWARAGNPRKFVQELLSFPLLCWNNFFSTIQIRTKLEHLDSLAGTIEFNGFFSQPGIILHP
jgi:hypothetical protein